jgi:hypothetical protein
LQPSFVPVQRASSRSHSSTVRVGEAPSISTTAPRWKKRIGRLIGTGVGTGMDMTPKLNLPGEPHIRRHA